MICPCKNLFPNTDIINPRYSVTIRNSFAVTGLAIGAIFVPNEAIKIIGLTILTGACYGIINDMIACRDCIEYFTVKHVYRGKALKHRPIKTLNPNLNAIVWGIVATQRYTSYAGLILAFSARVPLPGATLKISAVQLAPYMAIGSFFLFILAEVKARLAQEEMNERPYKKRKVPLSLQAGWEACYTRNSTGYAGLAIGGIALLTAIIAARFGVIRM